MHGWEATNPGTGTTEDVFKAKSIAVDGAPRMLSSTFQAEAPEEQLCRDQEHNKYLGLKLFKCD